ncbi:hypothetical protein [Arthrobacter pigmenti]
MSINWDHGKLPRRQVEWEAFIEALATQQRGGEKPFEDFWLEQKSQMDPLKSPGLGKIAKCLIGMANRQPSVSSRAMNGHGLMVCGLNKGARVGVSRTEDHELENALRVFLGDEGPVWTSRRLPADHADREILILVVDPPQEGDPIHVSFKESEGISDGGVFVRSKTETRSVRGSEHRALVQRMLLGGGKPDLDITVELATPLYGAIWEPSLLEKYLERERGSLLSSLNSSQSGNRISNASSLVGAAHQRQETRTQQRFENEVRKWSDDSIESTDDVAEAYLARALPAAIFRITNKSEVFLKNVEVEVHLEGEVRHVVHHDEAKLNIGQCLPDRPRKYGPYNESPLGLAGISSGYLGIPWQSSFRNSGSIDAVFQESALRPRGEIMTNDDDSVLYLPAGQKGDKVRGSWTLTAENIDGRYEGELEIVLEAGIRLGENLITERVVNVIRDFRES